MNRTYAWRGGVEQLRVEGDPLAPTILILPALFEEGNRLRHMTVTIMRRLAAAGLGTMLPDLPGLGESEMETDAIRLAHWRAAVGAVAALVPAERRLAVALRGGALLDDAAGARAAWRLSPETGARVVRDLRRASAIGGATGFAGYPLSETFADELAATSAVALPARTIRLEGDSGAADRHVAAAPPWRLAEPSAADDLAALLADDIIGWARDTLRP